MDHILIHLIPKLQCSLDYFVFESDRSCERQKGNVVARSSCVCFIEFISLFPEISRCGEIYLRFCKNGKNNRTGRLFLTGWQPELTDDIPRGGLHLNKNFIRPWTRYPKMLFNWFRRFKWWEGAGAFSRSVEPHFDWINPHFEFQFSTFNAQQSSFDNGSTICETAFNLLTLCCLRE